MVVATRSYGITVAMVKRGPQWVQVMNGWRWRRSPGSASSLRQSAQVAVSGGSWVRPADSSVGRMVKESAPPVAGRSSQPTPVTEASGGGCSDSRSQKRPTPSAGPSTSMSTPFAVLLTNPPSARSAARRWT